MKGLSMLGLVPAIAVAQAPPPSDWTRISSEVVALTARAGNLYLVTPNNPSAMTVSQSTGHVLDVRKAFAIDASANGNIRAVIPTDSVFSEIDLINRNGVVFRKIPSPTPALQTVAISPDGHLVAILLYDFVNGADRDYVWFYRTDNGAFVGKSGGYIHAAGGVVRFLTDNQGVGWLSKGRAAFAYPNQAPTLCHTRNVKATCLDALPVTNGLILGTADGYFETYGTNGNRISMVRASSNPILSVAVSPSESHTAVFDEDFLLKCFQGGKRVAGRHFPHSFYATSAFVQFSSDGDRVFAAYNSLLGPASTHLVDWSFAKDHVKEVASAGSPLRYWTLPDELHDITFNFDGSLGMNRTADGSSVWRMTLGFGPLRDVSPQGDRAIVANDSHLLAVVDLPSGDIHPTLVPDAQVGLIFGDQWLEFNSSLQGTYLFDLDTMGQGHRVPILPPYFRTNLPDTVFAYGTDGRFGEFRVIDGLRVRTLLASPANVADVDASGSYVLVVQPSGNDFYVVRTSDGLKGPVVHYPGLVLQSVVDQFFFRRFFSIGDAGLIGGGISAPDIRCVSIHVQADGALTYSTNAGYCGRLYVPNGQAKIAVPQGVSMAGGFRLSGNANSFLRLDGNRLVVQAPAQSKKVMFEVVFFGGGPLPKPLSFDTVARVRRLSDQQLPAAGTYQETIEYYNWRTSMWDVVASSDPGLGFEERRSRAGAPNGLDYTPSNHVWKGRVTVTRTAGTSTDWVAQFDCLNWTWP